MLTNWMKTSSSTIKYFLADVEEAEAEVEQNPTPKDERQVMIADPWNPTEYEHKTLTSHGLNPPEMLIFGGMILVPGTPAQVKADYGLRVTPHFTFANHTPVHIFSPTEHDLALKKCQHEQS